MAVTTVQVQGLTELRKKLKRIDGDLPKQLNAAAKQAAGLVADEARLRAPVLKGRLRATVKAGATAKGSYVKAGGSLVYAKPIMFGWPRHHIEPNRFVYEAFDAKRAEVIASFAAALQRLVATV